MSKNLKKTQTKTKKQPKVDWFVLRGFNVDNNDETGFLALDKSENAKNTYKIVDSQKDAMKFPSMNIYNKEGFGTPKQWLEFFKGEYELENWKFRLMKIKKMS